MSTTTTDEKILAWRALMALHATVVDAIERHLQAGGAVPFAWFEVLVRLSRAADASMRMQDLAGVLLLSRSGVTRLADRLESAGLIERRTCATDRRGMLAALTDAGREAIDRGQPLVRAALDEHFARHLTRTDARTLLPILQHLLEASRDAGGAAGVPAQRAASKLKEPAR